MASESASPFRLPIAPHCLHQHQGIRISATEGLASHLFQLSSADHKPPTRGNHSYGPMPKLPSHRPQFPEIWSRVFLATVSTSQFQHIFLLCHVPSVVRAVLTETAHCTRTGHSNKDVTSDIAVPHALSGTQRPTYRRRQHKQCQRRRQHLPATAQTSHARILAFRVTPTVCGGLGVGRETMLQGGHFLSQSDQNGLNYPRSIAAVRIDPFLALHACLRCADGTVICEISSSPVGVR